MGVIYFEHKGNFNKVENFFKRLLKRDYLSILNKYGQMGVDALRAATPVDSGLTASSWKYSIEIDESTSQIRLIWSNTNLARDAINIAVLIDRGHATRSGTWVEGQHFIDPAISPIIAKIAEEVTL